MKLLIANPGSTSYKCKLIEMDGEKILFQASVERIGESTGRISTQFTGEAWCVEDREIPDYPAAIHSVLDILGQQYGISDVAAVGFKTVHAKDVTGCVSLTDDVLQAMREYMPLVPVHNQVYLTAIAAFKSVLPETPLLGLFETHFHQDIPLEAAFYGVPYAWYEKHGVRKYGFHGASHRYISIRARELYGANRIISCHLGGSSSICAVRDGKSVDTSMGMSAQAGLLNASRVGDLDAFALLYVMEKEQLSIEALRKILIQEGGVKGISELSGDFRDIQDAMEAGNAKAELAFKTFAYHAKRYIGEYLAVLNGADVIVLTGGTGQHSPLMREKILSNMENLGVILDAVRNAKNPAEGLISAENSPVRIAIIPTNEELIVAREVARKVQDGLD